MNKKEFIEKSIKIWGNIFDYSEVEFTKISDIVKIIDKTFGPFYVNASFHIRNKYPIGCQLRLRDEFIKKSKEMYGENTYNYSEVIFQKYTYETTVILTDNEYNYKFTQRASRHLSGQLNKFRIWKNRKIKQFKIIDTIDFIKQSKELYGDIYDYSEVNFLSLDKKIILIDKEYNYKFIQKPRDHLSGKLNKFRHRGNILKKEFSNWLEKAKSIHGNFYDYSKVIYQGTKSKVIIIDPDYGEFDCFAGDHIRINRSERLHPKRASERISKANSISKEKFLKKAKQIHGEEYDYSQVNYIDFHTEIYIIHKLYGGFWVIPEYHCTKYGQHPILKQKFSMYDTDHIIPLSIIIGTKDYIDINRPLFKFLDSEINKQKIFFSENRSKSDSIYLDGTKVRARNFRNNYEIIKKICLEQLGIDISTIISEDINYMNSFH